MTDTRTDQDGLTQTSLFSSQTRPKSILMVGVLLSLIVQIPVSGFAQTDSPPSTPGSTATTETLPTLELIETARKEADSSTTLDDVTKKAIADLCTKAVESIRSTARSRDTLQALQRDADGAADEVGQIQEFLQQPLGKFQPPVAEDVTPEEIQSDLTRVEGEVAEARKRRTELDALLTQRAAQRPRLPDLITQTQKELAELEKQLATNPPEGEAAELTRARQAYRALHRAELKSLLALRDQEGPLYDATARLLTARRDRAQRSVTDAERRLEEWQKARSDALKQQARQQAQAAFEAMQTAHPEVGLIARRNQELTEINEKLVTQLDVATRERDETRKRNEQLQTEFNDLQQRAEAADFTEAIGHLLRSHRSGLPAVDRYQDRIAERAPVIAELNLDLIQYERERRSLVDLQSATDANLRNVRAVNETDAAEIRRQVEQLLIAQRENLSTLTLNAASCLNTLVSLDSIERKLIEDVQLQHDYIAEHVLWVQSATEMYRTGMDAYLTSAGNLRQSGNWVALSDALRQDFIENSVLWLGSAVTLLLLISMRHRWRNSLRELGTLATRKTTTTFRPTAKAAALTLAIALPWPLLLLFLGWRLDTVRGSDWFVRAAAPALSTTGALFLCLEFLRQTFRSRGLADSHFGWSENVVVDVRRALRRSMMLGLPLALIVSFCRASQDVVLHASIGRLAFVIACLQHTVLFYLLVKPDGSLMRELQARAARTSGLRLYAIWRAVTVGGPLTLGVAAFAGYYYTTLELAWRTIATLGVAVGLVLLRATLDRWLLVSYRELAIRKNRERREAMLRAAAERGESSDVIEPEPVPEIQLSTLNDQTQRLFRLVSSVALLTGVWLIWSEVLPALAVLKHVQLWDIHTPGVGVTGSVTLAEIALSLLVLLVTFTAGRNLPGLLEIGILQRLPLDAGARYAATTIIRYLIAVVGVVGAFSLAGISWSSVQWLVAAMSVGLGFGLQEIFANFVSGMILLFERPIRVGDTVTVNDVTGTVSRIRIRATTILDWNNKELIVPNRDFVTGNLVNWTLSNSHLRVIIPVGIAYGSDTELATKLLYEVAQGCPNVLKEPEPVVVFTLFGDSTLNFDLRCFVPTPQIYRRIPHELNMAIDKTFREHGIEIAFPQRDLHVRSIDERILGAVTRGQDSIPIEAAGRSD